MKKNKNKNKVIIGLIIIIFIALLGIASYFVYDKYIKSNDENEVKVIKEISKYNYKLLENKTQLYKDEFETLDEILNSEEINYDEYAKQVAKMFIIDFYTLSNKESKNDIGGTEYIKESMRDNFIEEARSTFYKYLEVKSENRTQKLPEVSIIENVLVEKTSFTYSDKTTADNAYKVTISWNYIEDLGYEKEAKMILVKENEKLYIVEMD